MLLNTYLKRFLAIMLALFAMVQVSQAQKGTPYITNFTGSENFDYHIWDIQKAASGEMLFACKKGVISFNGAHWNIHSLEKTPLKITQNSNHETIATSPGSFGHIYIDSSGSYTYSSIYNSNSYEVFNEVVAFNNKLAIIGDSTILILDNQNKTEQLKTDYNIFPVSGSFAFNEELHIISHNKLFKLSNDSLLYIKGLIFPLNNEYLFHVKNSNDKVYIANTDNKIFKYNGKSLEKVKIKDQEYLNQTLLTEGTFINDSLLALSTTIGGVIIVNLETGKTSYSINYSTGLPDDQVYDIFSEKNNELWIAHAQGISRVDLNLPIKRHDIFPGLSGNLLSFTHYQNKKFIGTSNGLFYLDKVGNYASKRISVKVMPKAKPERITVKKKEEKEEEVKTDKKRKRRLRNFFRRFSNEEETTSAPKVVENIADNTKNAQPQYKTKTIYKLLSSAYEFKKIEKVKGKCLHLLEFNGLLVAGSNTGLYMIEGTKATWLIPNAYINQIIVSKYSKNTLLIAANKGLYIAKYNRKKWDIKQHYLITDEVNSVVERDKNTIVLGDFGQIRVLKNPYSKPQVEYFDHSDFLMEDVRARWIDNQIICFTSNKAYIFSDDKFVKYNKFGLPAATDYKLIFDQSEFSFIKTSSWSLLNNGEKYQSKAMSYLSVFDKIDNLIVDDKDNLWVIDRANNLYEIQNKDNLALAKTLTINTLSIKNKNSFFIPERDIVLSYRDNELYVIVSSPFYLKSNAVKYQYKLEGLMEDWSAWSQQPRIEFPFIPPGQYALKIKSRTALGNESETLSIPITIQKPFTQTTLFYIIILTGIALIFFLIFRLRTVKLKRDKRILEQKVVERTQTIREQKERIEIQRDNLSEQKEEITTQRDEIEGQKNRIEEQHSDIKKSITYAKRIQTAVLQKESIIKDWFTEYFIFFKPRDIVSGDFYWINKIDNKVIVVAADCTGHGVPGAFMSMLGVSFLNEITASKKNLKSHLILNSLRDYVKNTLSQQGNEGETKDGMDISLVIFDFDANYAEFSGAYNSLYMIRKGELSEIKADKMPVGIYLKDKNSFTRHEIQLKKGDLFYMFSDGFPDQFGGEKGRKFMRKAFKKLLLDIHSKPMKEQKTMLDRTFKNWVGTEYHQTDDVIVIGVKV